ncbi:MAG: hypothetical protein OCC49_14810 [Fibrobacterales bacterium]
MKAVFSYPTKFWIENTSENKFDLNSQFAINDIQCSLTLKTNQVSDIKNEDGSIKYFYCNCYLLQMELQKEGVIWEELSKEKVYSIVYNMISEVIKYLRSIGLTKHIRVPVYNKKYSEYYLDKWEFNYSADEQLIPLISKSGIIPIGLHTDTPNTEFNGELKVNQWDAIDNALKNQDKPPIQNEFIVRALEYLEKEDLRSSIIEATIALEIVVSSYLTKQLESREFANEKIKNFLKPTLDLHSRVSVLISLFAPKIVLDHLNFTNVLTCIKWRNNIIHKTGDLPEGINTEESKDKIFSMISMVFYLDTAIEMKTETKLVE